MSLPKIIDNARVELGETLRGIAKDHSHLSIATGYWDLPGTKEILEQVKGYEKIRLLIGQEPLMPRYAKQLTLDTPEPAFPGQDFSFDLTLLDDDSLRQTIVEIKKLIEQGILEVRVFRRSFLHAKAYIFGDYSSPSAIGIIGSSNFTKAGLTTNTELNALEPNYQIVKFKPMAETDEHGHLSWFDDLWNDELTENWDGRFSEILSDSPLGDLTFGAYDMYIKTLMEVYPDELIPKTSLDESAKDILYWFQYRNAQILINKLVRMGLAMLSDSVGLGKTITAGAVIQHFHNQDASRIYVIAPAGLKSQWREDLADRFGLTQEFEVISLQDPDAITAARKLDKYKNVDLFVIDEAHNLRNENSKRHQQLLEWFLDNPDSKVLLLTATPINNSLIDFVNQIQLASKGRLDSINVDYRDEKGKLHKLDFFEALKQIQGRISRAEKEGKEFEWDTIKDVVASGLRHYLVRSTRQGIKDAGGIKLSDGTVRDFPESKVQQIGYHYSERANDTVNKIVETNIESLENIDSRLLDVDSLLELTQRSSHPLDIVHNGAIAKNDEYSNNTFANIFQIVLLLGFAPYKPETYTHQIYGKSIEEIRALGLKGDRSFRVLSQLGIHNMLRITFLKRIESSQEALRKSLENYKSKLELFESYLDRGYILSFKDIDSVINDFNEDVDKALEEIANNVEEKIADPDVYKIEILRKDLDRDKKLIQILIQLTSELSKDDDKLLAFASKIKTLMSSPELAHKKILVFSYFADTIKYLEQHLPPLINNPNFSSKSAFVTGGNSSIDSLVGRFSPKSKKYDLKESETEIDFLFATDVLSEGQNLQDAGTLINFDLHWNPVRMIQRNGRINRLGSEFSEVFIYNMKPEDNLETYLKLLRRLERKINTIKHTIGTDQNITKEGQTNPKEFVEELNLLDQLEKYEDQKFENTEDDDFKVESLYSENGSNALTELSQEEDEFYVEDQFVYELRNFLSANEDNQELIHKVKNIPLSKWGYLPKDTELSSPSHILALAKTSGKTSVSGTEIIDTHFSVIEGWGEYKASPVEDITALKLIRADVEDNERHSDQISFDRKKTKQRAIALANSQTRKKIPNYIPKPGERTVLVEFEKLLPGRNLLSLIQYKITNKRELKAVQKIFRDSRAQLKEHNQILPNQIQAMETLSRQLANKTDEETIINETQAVLFYAKK